VALFYLGNLWLPRTLSDVSRHLIWQWLLTIWYPRQTHIPTMACGVKIKARPVAFFSKGKLRKRTDQDGWIYDCVKVGDEPACHSKI
jgi:hypothetical protein